DRQVAAWVADLSHSDSAKQRAAHEALVKAGPKAKSAVPALVKMLDPKDNRAGYAIEVLGAIGPAANAAVPALLARLPKEDGWGYTVDAIAHALARIDGPKPEATRALLLSSGRCVPIYLVNSRTLFEYPAQVVPHIIALCRDEDE